MKKPIEPVYPLLPRSRCISDSIYFDIYEDIKASDIVSRALEMIENHYKDYPGFKIEGEWYVDEFLAKGDSGPTVALIKGGEYSWRDISYEDRFKDYSLRAERFSEELEKYESDLVIYNNWKKAKSKDRERREKERMKQKILSLTNKLTELNGKLSKKI